MAKRKGNPDDFFIDDDPMLDKELSELDAMFDMDVEETNPDSREPVLKTVTKMGKGFTDSAKENLTLDGALNLANKALPRSLSSEMNDILSVKDELKNKVTDSLLDIKRTGKQTVRAIDKIIPAKGMARNVLEKIKAKLGDDEPSQEAIQANTQTEEIATAMSEIFGEQNKQERLNEMLRQSIEEKRYKSTNEILAGISANTGEQLRYDMEISSAYQRRDLELKYKSLFIAREQLSIIKTSMVGFKSQFETLIHNTALPDIIKARGPEMLKETIKANARNQVSELFYSDINPLMNLKKNIGNKITETAQNFKDGLNGITDTADAAGDMGEVPGGKARMFGNMLGELSRNMVAGKIGDRIGKTKYGKEGVFKFKNAAMDVNEFFGEQAKKADSDGVMDGIKRNLFGTLKDLSASNRTHDVKFGTADMEEAALFDNKAKDSIVKVIPGLLSKIYGEIKSIRTKDDEPTKHELYYDHTRNSFENFRGMVGNIKKDVALKVNRNVTPSMESLINKLVTDGGLVLGPKEREDVRKGIMKFYTAGGSIAPSALTSENFLSNFPKRLSKRVAAAASKLMEQAMEDPGYLDYINSDLKGIKGNLPNISSILTKLHGLGYNEIATSLGGMHYDSRTDGYKYNIDGTKHMLAESVSNLSEAQIKTEVDFDKAQKERYKKAKEGFNSKFKDKIDTFRDFMDLSEKEPEELDTTGKPRLKRKNIRANKPKAKSETFNSAKPTVNNKTEANDTSVATDTIESIKKAKDTVKNTFTRAKDTIKTPKDVKDLREQFFSSKEYLNKEITDFKSWLKSLGHNVEKVDTLSTATFDMRKSRVDNALDSIKREKSESIFSKLSDMFTKAKSSDTIKKLREEFFTSNEYRDKKVTDFKSWCDAQDIKLPDTDTLIKPDKVAEAKQKATDTIETLKKAKDNVKEAIKTKKTINKPEDLEQLKKEFFNSSEYSKGIVKDFTSWASSLGYNIKEDINTLRKRRAKENIANSFKDARSLDKRIMFDYLPRAVKGTAKLALKAPYYAGKGLWNAAKGIKNIATSKTMQSARSLDKKILKGAPGAAVSTAKGIGKVGKFGWNAIKGIASGIGTVGGLMFGRNYDKPIKPKAESKPKDTPKKDIFDTDSSGRRDGDWKDRLDLFKKKPKVASTTSVATPVKAAGFGIFELLSGALPMITGFLGKIFSVGGSILGATKLIPSILMKFLPGIGKLLGGAGGLAMKAGSAAIGGIAAAGGAVKNFFTGGKAATSAEAAVKGAGTASKVAGGAAEAATAAEKIAAKTKPNKIMAILHSFKDKILKKLGPVAGARMAAVLSAKIAARVVPVVGTALLVYNGGMIAKDMLQNDTPLLSAVSKQILGFDLFSDDDAMLDENGNPIKPDEQLNVKEDTNANRNDVTFSDDPTGEKAKGNISFWQKTKNVAASAGNSIVSGAKAAGSAVASGAKTAGNAIVNVTSNAYDGVKTGISNFMSTGSFNNNAKGPEKAKILNMLDKVSDRTGTDPNILKTFAAVESGLNPNDSARPASSASGLFQFLDSTWRTMLGKYGNKYGIAPGTSPFDPEANATMGAEYLKENAKIIEKVKPNPTITDLYLGHFLGAGGATKFLKAPQSNVGAEMMPREASANRNIFFSKDGRPKTLAEIYSDLDQKMAKRAVEYGFSPGTKPPSKEEGGTGEKPSDGSTLDMSNTVSTTSTNTPSTATPTTVGPSDVTSTTSMNTSKPSLGADIAKNTPVSTPTGGISPIPVSSPTVSDASSGGGTTATTPIGAKADVAKLTIAADSQAALGTMNRTLDEQLKQQIRMVSLLETLVKSNENILNKQPSVSRVVEGTYVPETSSAIKPINNPRDLGEPAISLKRNNI